jgi:ubiquinone/menaquinone biosynthesis C-methylase UbiE
MIEKTKDEILNHYYEEIYSNYLFGKSIQSSGIKYFENLVEKKWNLNHNLEDVLEVGSGSGEHFPYVKQFPTKSYVALDIREIDVDLNSTDLDPNFKNVIKFAKGDVQNLNFESNTFDRVVSTCLLHHVDEPLKALQEMRRVTKVGGEIGISLPTDPGLLNQLIKKVVSYPRIRKFTDLDPKLIYSLEHRNHIGGLLAIVDYVFRNDHLTIEYYPFKIKSWNLNVAVVVKVVKNVDRK